MQITINQERTLFDIIYTRKNNDLISYRITYDKERKLIIIINKKINNIPDNYSFDIANFNTKEAAENNLKEEFNVMFKDLKENGKLRENLL